MQGKKTHQESLFIHFQLSDHIPSDNFYRRLKGFLDLDFLYNSTSKHYGSEGQKSIDPVVFMKLMLVGYLENINSDRRIVAVSGMRMDILYFLGYDLGEALPWHSTLSRTRQLYGEAIFLDLFRQVLKLCVEKGLICGKRQAVDSALIPANASRQQMLERLVMEDASVFSRELDENAEEKPQPAKKEEDGPENRPYKSEDAVNNTHYSPSDPDARLTKKPGKPMRLYYRAQMGVDTAGHFITYIQAFKGNQADNDSLPAILEGITNNMDNHHIQVRELLADAGYSSGSAIRALIAKDIAGYIPNPGNYKPSRENEGFTYDAENDRYTCTQGVHLPFRRTVTAHNNPGVHKKVYQTRSCDCKNCPLKKGCTNAAGIKTLTDTVDKPLYDYMLRQTQSSKGRQMKLLRSATVEPVFGSLINYNGLNRINSKGLKQANKCMLVAATVYNLKKLLKHTDFRLKQAKMQVIKGLKCRFGQLLNSFSKSYDMNFLLLS